MSTAEDHGCSVIQSENIMAYINAMSCPPSRLGRAATVLSPPLPLVVQQWYLLRAAFLS